MKGPGCAEVLRWVYRNWKKREVWLEHSARVRMGTAEPRWVGGAFELARPVRTRSEGAGECKRELVLKFTGNNRPRLAQRSRSLEQSRLLEAWNTSGL